MTSATLVVPSIRKDSMERFCREWSQTELSEDTTLVLMEDNPKRTFSLEGWKDAVHLSWEDIATTLAEFSWIIPRRSDTVRSYAYLLAWQDARNEFIMSMDDDCYPSEFHYHAGQRFEGPPDMVAEHIHALRGRTRWFNTLNSVKPRGVPFKNLGERLVYLNHGLWTNVLDYDAPTQLVAPIPEEFSHDNRIVPAGQYFPMCGMNVCWRREITVLMYHLLMGCVDTSTMPIDHVKEVVQNCREVHVDGGGVLWQLPFDRFGDIWCGILMKKVCDHLGYGVSSGTPYIHHDRASDPFKNLRKEANGLEANEHFWEKVDKMTLRGSTPADCYWELGAQMGSAFRGTEHAWYFRMLGEAMQSWAQLFM